MDRAPQHQDGHRDGERDARRRVASAATRTWWAMVMAAFALGAALRAPTFVRPLLSDDEAIYATTADALTRGGLLYRDVVDHKPPLIYHVYQAGFSLFGPYATLGAHLFVVLAVLATAALLLLAIEGRDDDPDARWSAVAAAALFLVFSTTWHDYDALAANCELFVLPPQALAAWLLLRDGRRARPGGLAAHLGVGVLIGVSALFKYQGLTFLGVSVGLVIWWAVRGRMSVAGVTARAVVQVAGAALPIAAYLAWCARRGNAEAALYWFAFNFSYVGAGLTGLEALARGARRFALVGGAALVPYVLGLRAAVTTVRGVVATVIASSARRVSPAPPAPAAPAAPAVLGLLWLATSLIAVAAGGRFFGHYFHLILPPLCLLAAPAVVRLARRSRGARIGLAAACAIPALSFFALATVARPLVAAVDEGEPPYDRVAARIDALSTPTERLFVWGNSPQLYVLAMRPMGTRFSFCNYMTGESPGTPTETGARDAATNQLAAAWDMLFLDLDDRRPALFVDAAAAGWDGYDKFPIALYPRLQAYLAAHYRRVEVADGVVIYRRADPG